MSPVYWKSHQCHGVIFGGKVIINRVISQTNNSLHVILSMSGEEDNWLVESEFRIENEKLVDLFIDESSSFTRVRCKGKT